MLQNPTANKTKLTIRGYSSKSSYSNVQPDSDRSCRPEEKHGKGRRDAANGQKIGWGKNGNTSEKSVHSVFYHAEAGRWLSRRAIPSPWGSIRRVWRRKSVGQEIKYYPEERGWAPRVSVIGSPWREFHVSSAGHQKERSGRGSLIPRCTGCVTVSHGYPGQITS